MTGDAIDVVGGAGGTTADLVAMLCGGSVLTSSGGRLVEAGEVVARTAVDPALLPGAIVDPGGYAAVQARLVPLVAGLGLLGARTVALGHGVRAAAVAYGVTERATEALFVTARNAVARQAGQATLRALPRMSPYALAAVTLPIAGWISVRGYPLLLAESRRLGTDVLLGRFSSDSLDDRLMRMEREHARLLLSDVEAMGAVAADWAGRHPAAGQQLVGAVPAFLDGLTGPLRTGVSGDGTWPPRDVEELALLAAMLGAHVPLLDENRRVAVAPAGPAVPAPAPRGVADLLRRMAPYTPPVGAPPGTPYTPGRVRVDRLDGPTGRSWVVTLPPTQSWSPTGGPNPFDASSNVHLMADEPAASSRAAVEAMRASGVRPGEPVMLVGYSQGGLTAVQMAGDPDVRARFDVTSVLTAGAPAGLFEPPDGVDLLSLEHRQDLVVAADGVDNPDHPAWTTVRRDLGADGTPLTAHRLAPYVETAAAVDESSDDSVRAWIRSAAPFLDAPARKATTIEYDTVRTP